MTALRFLVAAVGVFWLPRPAVSWKAVLFIGLSVFTGQFLLQFFGIALGMPAGLTAFVVQSQALFTVVFAAMMFGDRPTSQQAIGMGVALVGLFVISLTLNGNVPMLAFALTLASALSWASGNLVIKRLPKVNMLHLMGWASLVPPVPALLLSFAQDGPGALLHAVAHASMWGLLAPVYLGLLATVLAYAIWGNLLQRYSTGTVAPYALLAPAVGLSMSSLVYGERFNAIRLAGMILLLTGVAITAGLLNRWRRTSIG